MSDLMLSMYNWAPAIENDIDGMMILKTKRVPLGGHQGIHQTIASFLNTLTDLYTAFPFRFPLASFFFL
jgi:uncharacterized protein involved in tolerance to divalent cations